MEIVFDMGLAGATEKQEKVLLSVLTLGSMEANYPELVESKGFEGADKAMSNLYGDAWEQHKETIWQWYDKEVS